MKQRLLGGQLSKDGPCAPDINGGGVSGRTQENLRSAVPQRYHLSNRKACWWDKEAQL